MLAALLLTFREGLEAALLVGIILSYLGQIDQTHYRRQVWWAVGAAGALSLALAVALQIFDQNLAGRAEQVFEGGAMLLAVGVLTWMIAWMRAQARLIKSALQAEMRAAVRRNQQWGLFSVTFLAVFREGVELALFLTAASLASGGRSTWTGGLVGLAAAVVVGWAIYTGTARLNVRRFFDVTSVVLLVFAAGLFAHGLHEFQEAGWLPILSGEMWNTAAQLDDHSTVGALLRTMIGYNDNPTALEVLGYLGYWAVVWTGITWWANRQTVRRAAPSNA